MNFAEALVKAIGKAGGKCKVFGEWNGLEFMDGSLILQKVYLNGCCCSAEAESSIVYIPPRCATCSNKCVPGYHYKMGVTSSGCNVCNSYCVRCHRDYKGLIDRKILT